MIENDSEKLRFYFHLKVKIWSNLRKSSFISTVWLFVFGATVPPPSEPQWPSSFTRFLDYAQPRTTIGRTPLDEWSARRRDLYPTTHNSHNKHSCPPVVFEPTISAGERPQTYALDRLRPLGPTAATGTDCGQWDRLHIDCNISISQQGRNSDAIILPVFCMDVTFLIAPNWRCLKIGHWGVM